MRLSAVRSPKDDIANGCDQNGIGFVSEGIEGEIRATWCNAPGPGMRKDAIDPSCRGRTETGCTGREVEISGPEKGKTWGRTRQGSPNKRPEERYEAIPRGTMQR